MTGRGSTSMASRGDTLSTSWTPIDQVPSPSKYPPSIARGSPSSKIPPGREQLSSYGSASSSSHGNQAHLVAHRGQVGTLRACETEGAYIPALSDWTGLIDFSVHPSKLKFQWLPFNEVTYTRIKTEPCGAPGSPFPSTSSACSALL